MKWHNTQKDALPSAGQKVLLSADGVYYLAVYKSSGTFVDSNDSSRIFSAGQPNLYWTELDTTGKSDE